MCVLSFAVRMTSPAYINLAENSSARTHFRATQHQGKENRVSTQSMPRPLRGTTHTLKHAHHNHVVVGPV